MVGELPNADSADIGVTSPRVDQYIVDFQAIPPLATFFSEGAFCPKRVGALPACPTALRQVFGSDIAGARVVDL